MQVLIIRLLALRCHTMTWVHYLPAPAKLTSPACFCRMLTGQQQAQRCADFVSLAFSSTACLAAALQLLSYAVDSPEASQQARERATKVVCIAAGFFAFRLWTLVHRCPSHSVCLFLRIMSRELEQ